MSSATRHSVGIVIKSVGIVIKSMLDAYRFVVTEISRENYQFQRLQAGMNLAVLALAIV